MVAFPSVGRMMVERSSAMDKAKIALIEDVESNRLVFGMYLEDAGHEIVVEATNLGEALAVVDGIADGIHEVDVVLLDGNLQPETDTYDDARAVAERIKERGVSAVVIGFSLGSLNEKGIPVHADTYKSHKKLLEIIRAL